MQKKLLLLSLIMLCGILVFCQSEDNRDVSRSEKPPGKFEIGINVTSVISRFVGNESQFGTTDFPVLLRIHKERAAIRIGIGADVQRTSFFDVTTGSIRETTANTTSLKLGWQKSMFQKEKLSFYFGFDLLGNIEIDQVESATFGAVSLKKNILRLGGGPLLGISFKFNDRVRLHTESNITAFYQEDVIKEVFGNAENEIFRTQSFGGLLEPPLFLFLNVRF